MLGRRSTLGRLGTIKHGYFNNPDKTRKQLQTPPSEYSIQYAKIIYSIAEKVAGPYLKQYPKEATNLGTYIINHLPEKVLYKLKEIMKPILYNQRGGTIFRKRLTSASKILEYLIICLSVMLILISLTYTGTFIEQRYNRKAELFREKYPHAIHFAGANISSYEKWAVFTVTAIINKNADNIAGKFPSYEHVFKEVFSPEALNMMKKSGDIVVAESKIGFYSPFPVLQEISPQNIKAFENKFPEVFEKKPPNEYGLADLIDDFQVRANIENLTPLSNVIEGAVFEPPSTFKQQHVVVIPANGPNDPYADKKYNSKYVDDTLIEDNGVPLQVIYTMLDREIDAARRVLLNMLMVILLTVGVMKGIDNLILIDKRISRWIRNNIGHRTFPMDGTPSQGLEELYNTATQAFINNVDIDIRTLAEDQAYLTALNRPVEVVEVVEEEEEEEEEEDEEEEEFEQLVGEEHQGYIRATEVHVKSKHLNFNDINLTLTVINKILVPSYDVDSLISRVGRIVDGSIDYLGSMRVFFVRIQKYIEQNCFDRENPSQFEKWFTTPCVFPLPSVGEGASEEDKMNLARMTNFIKSENILFASLNKKLALIIAALPRFYFLFGRGMRDKEILFTKNVVLLLFFISNITSICKTPQDKKDINDQIIVYFENIVNDTFAAYGLLLTATEEEIKAFAEKGGFSCITGISERICSQVIHGLLPIIEIVLSKDSKDKPILLKNITVLKLCAITLTPEILSEFYQDWFNNTSTTIWFQSSKYALECNKTKFKNGKCINIIKNKIISFMLVRAREMYFGYYPKYDDIKLIRKYLKTQKEVMLILLWDFFGVESLDTGSGKKRNKKKTRKYKKNKKNKTKQKKR